MPKLGYENRDRYALYFSVGGELWRRHRSYITYDRAAAERYAERHWPDEDDRPLVAIIPAGQLATKMLDAHWLKDWGNDVYVSEDRVKGFS